MARGESVVNPATGMPYTMAEAQAQASMAAAPSALSAESRQSVDAIFASDEQKQKSEKAQKRGLAAFFSRVKPSNQLGRATILAGTAAIGYAVIASQGESNNTVTQIDTNAPTNSVNQVMEGPMPSAAALSEIATITNSPVEQVAPIPAIPEVQPAQELPVDRPAEAMTAASTIAEPVVPVAENTISDNAISTNLSSLAEPLVAAPSVGTLDAMSSVEPVPVSETREVEVPKGSSITEVDGKTPETVDGYYLADIIIQNRDAFPNASQYSDAQLIDMAWEASQDTPEGRMMNDYLVELTWEYPEGIYTLSTEEQLLAMEAKEDAERATTVAATTEPVAVAQTTEIGDGTGGAVPVTNTVNPLAGDGTQGPAGVAQSPDTYASTTTVASAGIPQSATENPLVAAASNTESSKPFWKRILGR
jgi:hypothetical protein